MVPNSHRTLAQHYFLDALDLHRRFKQHWEDQPRKSSRIKSFVDLMMACECMLKSQCILARSAIPFPKAFAEVRKLAHNVNGLSRVAESAYPSTAQERARRHFGKFAVRLRYSADAYAYFFPVGSKRLGKGASYDETLGDSAWLTAAESVVTDLIEWGRSMFNGEVLDDIEANLLAEQEVELAVNGPPQKKPRSPVNSDVSDPAGLCLDSAPKKHNRES